MWFTVTAVLLKKEIVSCKSLHVKNGLFDFFSFYTFSNKFSYAWGAEKNPSIFIDSAC